MSEFEVTYTILLPKHTVKYPGHFGYPVNTDDRVFSDEFKYVHLI